MKTRPFWILWVSITCTLTRCWGIFRIVLICLDSSNDPISMMKVFSSPGFPLHFSCLLWDTFLNQPCDGFPLDAFREDDVEKCLEWWSFSVRYSVDRYCCCLDLFGSMQCYFFFLNNVKDFLISPSNLMDDWWSNGSISGFIQIFWYEIPRPSIRRMHSKFSSKPDNSEAVKE